MNWLSKMSATAVAALVVVGTGVAGAGPAAASAAPDSPRAGAVRSADQTYYFHTVWATGADCSSRGSRGISNGEWIDWICLNDGKHSPVYKWSLYVR